MKAFLSYIWLPVTLIVAALLLLLIEFATGKGTIVIFTIIGLAILRLLVFVSREIAEKEHWFNL